MSLCAVCCVCGGGGEGGGVDMHVHFGALTNIGWCSFQIGCFCVNESKVDSGTEVCALCVCACGCVTMRLLQG